MEWVMVPSQKLNMEGIIRRFCKLSHNTGFNTMCPGRFFNMAAAAIQFSNFKFLTVEQLNSAELRRRAKFGRNRSKRGRDMVIFRFSKMAAAAILDFSNFKFLTVVRLKRAELHRRVKFGWNRSKRGRDMAIFRFFKMAAATILDFSL